MSKSRCSLTNNMTLVPSVGINDQYMSPLTLAQPQESGLVLKPSSPKRKVTISFCGTHHFPAAESPFPVPGSKSVPLFCLSLCVIWLLASLPARSLPGGESGGLYLWHRRLCEGHHPVGGSPRPPGHRGVGGHRHPRLKSLLFPLICVTKA